MKDDHLFADKDLNIKALYDFLIESISQIGSFTIEPKKTSIHVVNKSAFLGIHPKTKWIDLNIVTDAPLISPRVLITEQVSTNRFHNTVRIHDLSEVDKELVGWIKKAYDLKS